jgi:hypothetical protein
MTLCRRPSVEALEQVERGLAGYIERYDFAVNDCVATQRRDSFHNTGKAAGEILLIA